MLSRVNFYKGIAHQCLNDARMMRLYGRTNERSHAALLTRAGRAHREAMRIAKDWTRGLHADDVASVRMALKRARYWKLALTLDDFVMIDGSPTLDGMDPNEWVDAVAGVGEYA